MPAACFATHPETPGWRGDRGWTERRKGKREEARQGGGSETGKEGGSKAERTKEEGRRDEARQGGGRKRGSAPRYSISKGASVRLCLTREE